MTSPDPVADAAAYQRLLLGLVGDDDPTAVQAGTPAAIRALIAEAGPHLRTRPAPGEWSVLEVVGDQARRALDAVLAADPPG